jgi:hypothetical protein
MNPIAPVIIATFVAVASPAFAQQPKVQSAESFASAPGRGEATRAVRVSATVTAIDKATRTLTLKLKGADGKTFPLVASAEVRNFDQIQVGSEVIVGYLQALAIELKKGGGAKVERVDSSASARAEVGAQPAGMAARKITATGDVIALDAATQTATVRGPNRTIELRVPDKKQFQMIVVGDQIQVTYTEALAVSVEPAPKK